MPPKVYPETPIFASKAEEDVFNSLYASLDGHDYIICNLRFYHPQNGDREIDFICLIKNRGILVIEVKGGQITHDGQNWIQSDRRESRVITPAYQARINAHNLRDLIKERTSQGLVYTEWGVAFPHSTQFVVNDLELPEYKIFFASDVAQPQRKITEIMSDRSTHPRPSGDAWMSSVLLALQPHIQSEIDFNQVLENNHEQFRELTHARQNLLIAIQENNRYMVAGPAGSGKTWMAFEQAKLWRAQGLRVAMIAYNRGVVSYLKNKNQELPSELRVNGIYTFNEYSKKIGAKVSAPGQLDENSDADADGLIAAADNLPAEQRFDAFIIDEAQDFMRSWWNTIEHSLVDRANGKIAAFGDDQQRVFGTRLAPEFPFFKIRLHENIRNAKQIADLAAHFAKTQIAVRGPSAFPIDFIECPQNEVVNRADDYVAKLVDEDGWQPEEIVLLTTKSRHPVQIEMESHGGKEEYYQRLWSEGEVFYATVGGFKGLERSVVVLAIDGYHNAEDLDNFIYVGLTRARDKLAVIADPAMMQRLRRG